MAWVIMFAGKEAEGLTKGLNGGRDQLRRDTDYFNWREWRTSLNPVEKLMRPMHFGYHQRRNSHFGFDVYILARV